MEWEVYFTTLFHFMNKTSLSLPSTVEIYRTKPDEQAQAVNETALVMFLLYNFQLCQQLWMKICLYLLSALL